MANIYIPTNVRSANMLSGSISIDWDVSQVMEKHLGSKYNVWGSNDDGVTWDLIILVVRRSEATFPNKYNWLSVSSIHPTLGESAKSIPLTILSADSVADVNKRTAVGVDANGEFHYLKVDDDGGLIIGEGLNILIDTEDLAKEPQQDEMLVNQASMLAIMTQMQIEADPAPDFIETTLLNVTPIGAVVTLPWKVRGTIDQVLVLQEAGAAANFEVQILATATTTAERDIITKMYSHGSLRLDILGAIPYINKSGLDELYIKIIPDAGTSNNYFVRIAGRIA